MSDKIAFQAPMNEIAGALIEIGDFIVDKLEPLFQAGDEFWDGNEPLLVAVELAEKLFAGDFTEVEGEHSA